MLREVSNENLTKEEKDAKGKIWASDAGLTYWFDSLDDVLDWMKEHAPDTHAAISARMLKRGVESLDG